MALKTTHALGDPIKAEDMNSQSFAIIQNQHNIFQLYLENFFASKITPFLGMFFDGFSDTSKTDIQTNVTVDTANKKLDLDAAQTSGTYESITTEFQQAMKTVRLWVVRNFTASAPNAFSLDFELSESDNLQISDGAQTGLDITGDLTIEAWVNFESLPGGEFTILSKANDTGGQKSYRFVLTNSTTLAFTTSDSGSNQLTATQSYTPTVGTWKHLAMVYIASAGSVEFFENGVSLGTAVTGLHTSIFNSTARLIIGATADAGGENTFLDGKMDEVRIWDVARTSTQIFDNYLKVLVGDESGLQGSWRFESDVLDQTANNNDLTNNGAAFVTDTPGLGAAAGKLDKLNLKAGISAGATSLGVDGDQTGIFSIGDIVDLSTPDNLTRERKTLTGVSFAASTTTLSFTATANAYTTDDFVERVNVIPRISLVDSGDAKSFQSMTLIRTELGTGVLSIGNGIEIGEVEDEYSFEASTAEEDFKIELVLTREDTDINVFAKRLGASLVK